MSFMQSYQVIFEIWFITLFILIHKETLCMGNARLVLSLKGITARFAPSACIF